MLRSVHALLITVLVSGPLTGQAESKVETQHPSDPTKPAHVTEVATFGAGCFWCVEAVYEQLPGVKSVTSGYAGGKVPNPTYHQVSNGGTGHAEVTQIEFDPSRITYAQLLEVFWAAHDPTTLNQQGADHGTQYRSIILYGSEAQKAMAEKSKREAAAEFRDPIVTEIVPLTRFYPAEEYHQDFFQRNPNQSYCTFVIRPKLEKLKKKSEKIVPKDAPAKP